MGKKLEFWGGLFTAVYLIAIAVTVGYKFQGFQALKLNELGDFLAGVFGPIAFLWLVLGFLQQGRELKLSSDALQLQAEELKNSVEQQKELVEINRKQFDYILEDANSKKELRAKDIRPEFIAHIDDQGVARSGILHLLRFSLSNVGKEVFKVKIIFGEKLSDHDREINEWSKNSMEGFTLTYQETAKPFSETCKITYIDMDHNYGSVDFVIDIQPATNRSPNPRLSVTPNF